MSEEVDKKPGGAAGSGVRRPDQDIGWPVVLVFAGAFLGGLAIAVSAFWNFGMADVIGEDACAISRDALEPIVLAVLTMAAAQPQGIRQLLWFGLLTLLLSLYLAVASWLAGLAQVYVGPGRLYFVSNATFILLAAPAYGAVMLAMKRLAMLRNRDGKPGHPHWIGITLPAFLAAALVLDMLDAAGLVVAGEDIGIRLVLPVLVVSLFALRGAQPCRPSHWILLGSAIGLLSVCGVALFSFIEWRMSAGGDNPFGRPAAAIITIAFQFAAIQIFRKTTDSTCPWLGPPKWK